MSLVAKRVAKKQSERRKQLRRQVRLMHKNEHARDEKRNFLLNCLDYDEEMHLVIAMERLQARINNEEPPHRPKTRMKLPRLHTAGATKRRYLISPRKIHGHGTVLPEFITRPRNKYERSLSIARLMYANELQAIPGKRLLQKLKPLSKRKRSLMKKSYVMSTKIQRNFRRLQAQRKYKVTQKVTRRGFTLIQAKMRGERARKKFRQDLLQRKAEYAASIRIQNTFRLQSAKKRLEQLKNERASSIKIQNRFRVRKARGELKRRKIKKARKEASTRIQSHFRANRARATVREKRTRRRAAVKIQNKCRGRKAWLELERRKEEKARADASVQIQNQFRANRARARLRELRLRQSAAVKIQTLIRAQQARGRVAVRRTQHSASVKIQNQVRKKNARVELYRRQEEKLQRDQCAAAVEIQQLCRGKIARNKLNQLREEHSASTKIQRHMRGKLVRNEIAARSNAATKIQSIVRRKRVINAFNQRRRHATQIQKHYRGHVARAQVSQQIERRQNSATALQAQVRRWQQRVRFSQALQRARTIQAQWRAHIARKKFGEMRRERFRQEASVRVQSVWRRQMVRTHMQRQRDSATQVQRGWRGFLGRRLAVEARRHHRARRLQRFWRRRRRAHLNAAAVRLQSCFRAQVQRRQYAAMLDGWNKIHRCIRTYRKAKAEAAANDPAEAKRVLGETLNALLVDGDVQDVVGRFWAALPGIATTSDHLVLRDAESSAPNVDVPAFAAINRIFYLALTPEDEVDDEAIAAMDDDAAAHWKRYVGESSSMDRGAFGRYALDIVSLYVEPERKPGQLPKYSPAAFVWLLNALYKATVHTADNNKAYPIKIRWVHDVSHSALLRCLCLEHSRAIVSARLRGSALTEEFQRTAMQCTGAFTLADDIKDFQRLETLKMVLTKVLTEGRKKLICECAPHIVRLKVTSKAQAPSGSALREQLDAIVGEYSTLQSVNAELGMRLGAQLESSQPVWRLTNDKSETAVPHIFATTDLRWHFSDLNLDCRWFTSESAAASPCAVTSWTSLKRQVDVSVEAVEEKPVMDWIVPTRTQREVPLLRMDQYGHLLRHMFQDVDMDMQLDAVEKLRLFVEQNGLLACDFFTVALSTIRAGAVLQDDCLLEWFDVTEEILDKSEFLETLLETATPWFEKLLEMEELMEDGRPQDSSDDDEDWGVNIL